MKNIWILIIVAAGFFSCTGDFEEINTNPNTTVVGKGDAYGMFEPLLYDGAKDWQYYTWFWNDELIQFTAFTGGTTREEHRYIISAGNWQSVWNMYARRANDAQHLYELALDQEKLALQAIALTYKVLYLSNLTDIFGDIPYSEAFSATHTGGTLTPKFDAQKDVYAQMFADLERANDIYATNPPFIKKKDNYDSMYDGKMENWRKFNNSLYLRLLCRISGRTEMNAGAKIAEIIGDAEKYPVITSNADNATVKFTGSEPYRNYFHATNNGDFTANGRKLTEQLIKMTVITDEITGAQTYTDPRLPIIGVTTSSGLWKGTVAGCTREEANIVNSGTSMLNTPVFCRSGAPTFLMDYAEVQFILAEAALKGHLAGGEAKAKEYYTAAITASLEKWAEFGGFSAKPVEITSADVAAFLDSDLASWDRAADKETLIAEQKYLALFWTGMEAYHEYRRTGYPVLTIGAGCVANDFILPTRFGYPNVTMATNYKNAMDAVNRMGGNDMKTPVWWSRQAILSGR